MSNRSRRGKSGRTRGSKKNSPPKSGKRRSDFERKKEQLKRRRGGGGNNGHGGHRSKSVPPKIKKEKKKRRSKLAKFFSKMCGTGPIALDFSLNDDALRKMTSWLGHTRITLDQINTIVKA